MEDEEMILMVRESQRHDEKKRKTVMRNLMLRMKHLGYTAIPGNRKALLKVFAGYLCGIGAFSNVEITEGLAQCIRRGDEAERIEVILSNRIQDQSLISQTLSSDIHTMQKFTLEMRNSADTRRVLVLHTGGTIGMVPNECGLLDTSKGALKAKIFSLPALNSRSPENPTFRSESGMFLYDLVDLDPLVDSSDMNPEYYARIINCIRKYYEMYSAFVILHGTDTLAYTAPMLDLFIENLDKPIFITGAAYSIFETEVDSDAYRNLLSTFNYVCKVRKPGVYVSFYNKLLCSKTVRKFSSAVMDMFSSREYLCDVLEDVPEDLLREATMPFPTRFVTPCAIKMASLYITPVNHLDVFDRVELQREEILLVHGYGNGNVPQNNQLFGLIEKHSANGGVTVVISQCPDGLVKPLYSSWSRLGELGVVPSGRMTIEFLVAKITYLVSKGLPWSLMDLMIYIGLDCNVSELCPDFCTFVARMLRKRGHVSTYIESMGHPLSEAIRNKHLSSIKKGDLEDVSRNPLLCFHVFKMHHGKDINEAIRRIDHLILRSFFVALSLVDMNEVVYY